MGDQAGSPGGPLTECSPHGVLEEPHLSDLPASADRAVAFTCIRVPEHGLSPCQSGLPLPPSWARPSW